MKVPAFRHYARGDIEIDALVARMPAAHVARAATFRFVGRP
jgi:hypothetical protein